MDDLARLERRLERERRARRSAEEIAERFTRDALHDPLTGLANRALLLDRLRDALGARRGHHDVLLAYVDLDGFKSVNDVYGHEIGDEILCALADRLRAVVRNGDTIARIGGDEFVVLAPHLDDDGVTDLIDRITRAACFDHVAHGLTMPVAASVGVAVPDPATCDPYDVLRDADGAMYAAKTDGRGLAVSARSLQHAARRRLHVARELRAAIDGDHIDVHAQPLVDLTTDRVVAVEALCRWTSPELGVVPPAEFIDVAERAGLITDLGRLVLRHACRAAAATGAGGPEVWVNLSPRQLSATDLVADVEEALTASDLPAARLWLEVTETLVVDNHRAVGEQIRRLRDLGVRMAIDDFGTGYSALQRLRTTPADALKIDRSFVDAVDDCAVDQALVRAMIDMAAALEMRCVAEGIERPETLARLRALGCSHGQGYLLGRPAPFAQLCPRTTTAAPEDGRAAALAGGRGGT